MLRNISILLTGTVIAQTIPLIAMPILTRLYTPAEFGMLAVFTSFASIFAIIANFRLDAAIISAESDEERIILRNLSFMATLFLTIVVILLLIIFSDFFKGIYKGIDYYIILYLIPLYILLYGTLQIYTYLANSKEQYKRISKSKIDKNLSMTLIQLILYKSKEAEGLIVGLVLGLITPIVRLSKQKKDSDDPKLLNITSITLKKYLQTLKKYKHYPLVSTPTAAMDIVAIEAPVIMMNKYHDPILVGYYDLAKRTILQPLSFISVSVSQVYLKRISDEKSTFIKVKITTIILGILFFIASIVGTIFLLWGEQIFAIIFGEEWRVVGVYSGILIFPFLIRFIVSPISVVFLKPENIKIGGIWQLLYLITSLTISIIYIPIDFLIYLKVFAITEVLIYTLYLILIYYSLIKRN